MLKELEINGVLLNIYKDGRVEIPYREYHIWNGYIHHKIIKRNKFLSPVKNGKAGYYQVKIHNKGSSKTMYIHRLVWIAHNGDIPFGYEVDHVDEDKSNNSLSNLCLLTRRQNMMKMIKSNPHVKDNFKKNT